MSSTAGPDAEPWPSLPYEAWKGTCRTLHLWTQLVGKVRFSMSPWLNHSWGVTLYVTVRGLTTSPVPHGPGSFQIDFAFLDLELCILTSEGAGRGFRYDRNRWRSSAGHSCGSSGPWASSRSSAGCRTR